MAASPGPLVVPNKLVVLEEEQRVGEEKEVEIINAEESEESVDMYNTKLERKHDCSRHMENNYETEDQQIWKKLLGKPQILY